MRTHKVFALVVGFVCAAGLGFLAVFPVAAQREADPQAALEVLARLNEWRLEKDLLPFKVNPTLEALALYQAQYVRSMRDIPNGSAIHIGRGGEGIQQRARYKQFGWPTYHLYDQIQVAEIAAVNSLDGAIAFWKSSKVHRETATNPAYREVGIAAIPHPFGYVYIVVLGARPNVLPTLVHPETGKLYLAQEFSGYAAWDEIIHEVDHVRLFDSQGRPLSDGWQDWNKTLDVPENAGDRLFVMYTNGEVETLSVVDLVRDIIVLPGHYPPPDPVLVSVSAGPTATPAPTATPEPPKPELLIVYDDVSITVINQSRRRLNLGQVSLRGNGITLPLSWWQEDRDAGIYDFGPGNCVQAWGMKAFSPPPRPEQCGLRRAGRSNLEMDERFWLDGDFAVYQGSKRLATCEQDAGECEVDVP